MAEHPKPLDISDMPDLLRLAEEVRASHEPRVLRLADEDLAMVIPVTAVKRRGVRSTRSKDLQAFRAAAGGWSDLDTDALVRDIYETRRSSTRPPVRL